MPVGVVREPTAWGPRTVLWMDRTRADAVGMRTDSLVVLGREPLTESDATLRFARVLRVRREGDAAILEVAWEHYDEQGDLQTAEPPEPVRDTGAPRGTGLLQVAPPAWAASGWKDAAPDRETMAEAACRTLRGRLTEACATTVAATGAWLWTAPHGPETALAGGSLLAMHLWSNLGGPARTHVAGIVAGILTATVLTSSGTAALTIGVNTAAIASMMGIGTQILAMTVRCERGPRWAG